MDPAKPAAALGAATRLPAIELVTSTRWPAPDQDERSASPVVTDLRPRVYRAQFIMRPVSNVVTTLLSCQRTPVRPERITEQSSRRSPAPRCRQSPREGSGDPYRSSAQNCVQLDVCLRPVVECVAGEVRGDLHVELGVPVAGVAAEKVAAAADVDAQSLAGLEDHGVGGEAEAQRDWLAGGEWFWVADVDRDLG
jgi:hypothetical protein